MCLMYSPVSVFFTQNGSRHFFLNTDNADRTDYADCKCTGFQFFFIGLPFTTSNSCKIVPLRFLSRIRFLITSMMLNIFSFFGSLVNFFNISLSFFIGMRFNSPNVISINPPWLRNLTLVRRSIHTVIRWMPWSPFWHCAANFTVYDNIVFYWSLTQQP